MWGLRRTRCWPSRCSCKQRPPSRGAWYRGAGFRHCRTDRRVTHEHRVAGLTPGARVVVGRGRQPLPHEVGQCGAHHAAVVDATVLEEPGVLDGEHRVLHHLGDFLDRQQVAALFAELADQHAVCAEHTQRELGPVVGQVGHVRQVGEGHRQRQAHDQQQREHARHGKPRQRHHSARKGVGPAGGVGCWWGWGCVFGCGHEGPWNGADYKKQPVADCAKLHVCLPGHCPKSVKYGSECKRPFQQSSGPDNVRPGQVGHFSLPPKDLAASIEVNC